MIDSIFIIQKTKSHFFDIELDKSNILKDRTLIITLIAALLYNVGQRRENENLIHLFNVSQREASRVISILSTRRRRNRWATRDNALTKCS